MSNDDMPVGKFITEKDWEEIARVLPEIKDKELREGRKKAWYWAFSILPDGIPIARMEEWITAATLEGIPLTNEPDFRNPLDDIPDEKLRANAKRIAAERAADGNKTGGGI